MQSTEFSTDTNIFRSVGKIWYCTLITSKKSVVKVAPDSNPEVYLMSPQLTRATIHHTGRIVYTLLSTA